MYVPKKACVKCGNVNHLVVNDLTISSKNFLNIYQMYRPKPVCTFIKLFG